MEHELTAKRLRALFTFDYETGKFYSARSDLRRSVGSTTKHGYVTLKVDGSYHMAHRLAWLYDKGKWPDGQIDHINGNRADNRIENLRDVDQTTNMQNQRSAHVDCASRLAGTYFHKRIGKHYAQIRVNKVLKHLGYFETPEEAHAAYLKAKRELHPGCTI